MERRVYSIEGNAQKLDGGAMYGNAPKALWEKWSPPDAMNRIDLACRALLVVEPNRTILLETGIGAFFEPKLKERFGVQGERHLLLDGLASRGLRPEDVDVVVLSHLHFDHAGGLLTAWAPGEPPRLAFPRARFVVGERAFARARTPHVRDRASYIPELPDLLATSGRLELVRDGRSEVLGPDYRLHASDGHTPGLVLTEVPTAAGPLVFAADLIPGQPWVRAAITMGYDRFPELLIDEKSALLEDLVARGGRLFYTHDPAAAASGLTRGPDGRVAPSSPVVRLDGPAA